MTSKSEFLKYRPSKLFIITEIAKGVEDHMLEMKLLGAPGSGSGSGPGSDFNAALRHPRSSGLTFGRFINTHYLNGNIS